MKFDLENFDWGPTSEWFRGEATKEIFERRDNFENNDYERLFPVQEGDIVVDIGSSVGEFPYSILHRKPKHIYVVEPLGIFFDTLKKNLEGHPVSFTNAAISPEKFLTISWDGHEQEIRTLTFKEFLTHNRLTKIDFLKVDCEGGEYDVFSEGNITFLKGVPKIVLEVHLKDKLMKEKFRIFRDKILPNFEKYNFYSVDGHKIDWDLQNEHFIEYYQEVMLYIDNRN